MATAGRERCIWIVHPRKSVGIMGKGRESTTMGPSRPCSRYAVEGDTCCATHARERDRVQRALAARRKLASR